MTQPGGGPHKVGVGQITDDSEQAICLIQALNEMNKVHKAATFDTDILAKWYGKWVGSEPFDIGIATEGALLPLKVKNPRAFEAKKAAQEKNDRTKSNGSLMRITPLAAWCINVNDNTMLKSIIQYDTEFVHANKIVQEVIFVYVYGLKYLLQNPDNLPMQKRGKAAFDKCMDLASSPLANTAQPDGLSAKTWLEEAETLYNGFELQKDYLDDAYHVIEGEGFIKHAFILSFYEILKAQKYDNFDTYYFDSIREIIKLGGDTDTNACIAGGIVGGLVGGCNLDDGMVKNLMSFDCVNTKDGQKRPKFLSVKDNALSNIVSLIRNLPQSPLIEIKEEKE